MFVDDGKTVTWVCHLNTSLLTEIIYLQPGNYKLEFRYENAKETLQTIEKQFTITSNSTLNLKL